MIENDTLKTNGSARRSFEEEGAKEQEMGDRNALNLRWTFGFNRECEAGTLVDLTSEGRQAVFYSVGHTGVIFDYELRRQRLLQGHTNTISCAAASDDKKWLSSL